MNIENWAYFDYFKILMKGGKVNYQINLLNCWSVKLLKQGRGWYLKNLDMKGKIWKLKYLDIGNEGLIIYKSGHMETYWWMGKRWFWVE